MDESDKITIIEGPPPTFEAASEAWPQGVAEGPDPSIVAVCRMRTFNGQELVERCARAWRERLPIHLEFRDLAGLTQQTQIIAARADETSDGDVLLLWVRSSGADLGLDLDFEADDETDPDDFDPAA